MKIHIRTTLACAAAMAAALVFGPDVRTALAADSPDDISAAKARSKIEDLKVGTALGTNGAVLDNKDDIHAGEPVYASFKTEELAIGTAIRAVWRGPDPDNARIQEETKNVTAGTRFMVFRAPETRFWKPGEYHVDIRIADELGGTEDFKIREAIVR